MNLYKLIGIWYAEFSEKLTFLKYQGVRNVSFLENFAYVLSGWPLSNNNDQAKSVLRTLSNICYGTFCENSSIVDFRQCPK